MVNYLFAVIEHFSLLTVETLEADIGLSRRMNLPLRLQRKEEACING